MSYNGIIINVIIINVIINGITRHRELMLCNKSVHNEIIYSRNIREQYNFYHKFNFQGMIS